MYYSLGVADENSMVERTLITPDIKCLNSVNNKRNLAK